MKFPAFQQLKEVTKGNVYIFVCDDDFLLGESEQVWRRLFGGEWNFEKLFPKEFGSISHSELVASAGTSSLFGEGRALMLKNAAKLPKKSLTELEEINSLDNSSLKILLCVSTRRALQAWVKTFAVVEIDPLTSADVVHWLKQRYDVRSDVARYIIESIGVELYPLYGEMEKLKTYVKQERQIEMKDVDVLILRSERYGPFALDDALLGKDYRKAVRVIEAMLEEGVEPLQILGKLANLWRKLFASWQLVEQGKGSDIARVVGVHDFVASKLRKAVLNFTAEALVEGFRELVELDKALKTTAARIHPQCSFNSMLWKMVGTRS